MQCVTSVSFSIKVNGELTEVFRQRNPISPYLFLLCLGGLSCLLNSIGPMHLSRDIRVGIHTTTKFNLRSVVPKVSVAGSYFCPSR